MTATLTKGLGILSLSEATRSLQAKGENKGRKERMRGQQTREDQRGEGEEEDMHLHVPQVTTCDLISPHPHMQKHSDRI